MTPQDCLNLSRLLAAGLIGRSEVSAWAEAQLGSAAGLDLTFLSELILAVSASATDTRDLVSALQQKGSSADITQANAAVAQALLRLIDTRALSPEAAFERFERFTDVFTLPHDQQVLRNQIATDISAWPHNDYPWGQITEELIPQLLRAVSETRKGPGAV